ncbi:MAG: DUF2071 domain-containing protein [Flavobacterium sp.]
MAFISAKWKNLIMANYVVNPHHLLKYLPVGTEIDLWENKCYVSLVGFLFKDTKVLGFKIPKHTDFEEVNLRFYVKLFENGAWKRGVVFIKEIVPRPAITFVANTIYKENYQTFSMEHVNKLEAEIRTVAYHWENHSIAVRAYDFSTAIDTNSEAAFITEHYFGYTKYDSKTTYEYEVKHPKWNQYVIKNYDIKVNFKTVYGNDFEFLNQMNPNSIFLVDGSEISVENKRKIT